MAQISKIKLPDSEEAMEINITYAELKDEPTAPTPDYLHYTEEMNDRIATVGFVMDAVRAIFGDKNH